MNNTTEKLTNLWNRIVLAKVRLTNTRTKKITRAMEDEGWQFREVPLKEPLLHFPSGVGATSQAISIDPEGRTHSLRDDAYRRERDRVAADIYKISPGS